MEKLLKGKKSRELTFIVFAILLMLLSIIGLKTFTYLNVNAEDAKVPEHTKDVQPNGDGTYTISLDVKGESEKVTPKVNVIVIVDRSGSMGESSGTSSVTYTATNDNGGWYYQNNLYGKVGNDYVQLTRTSTGYWPNITYHFYANGTEYTGQRYTRQEANQNRLQATQQAVNNLAQSLLAHNGGDNPNDTVEMALVSFSTTARTDVANTTSYSTYSNAVNALNADGGTNWEAALKQAQNISFGENDKDPTYVIFFSDGAPTFHSTNGGYNNWNRDYNVYGSGYEEEPNMERSYTQAKDDAATLASKVGKDNFYTIFAYGASYGSDYMTDITSDAGAPAGNNYSASNTAALQAAFAEILNKIEMAGFADITIEDGTTHRLESTSIELLDVVPNSFKYYRDGVEWKTTDNPAPPAATYNEETGKVEWKLDGLLDNGVTYKVTFDVYPTQETYDIIADIKNETTLQKRIDKYNELPASVRQYLTPTSNQYTDFKLATNTQAILKYKDTRVSNTEQSAIFDPPKPVSTEAETISIKKNWKNLLDSNSRSVNSIQLSLNRDGVDFLDATLTGPDWKKENIFIATGLMRTHTKTVDGEEITELEILDEGHDYKFNELGSEAYNWDLESEVVHPMIIDGTRWELVLVDAAEAPDMGNSQYKKVGEDEYYQLESGKVYLKKRTNHLIEATNNRRSSLNITKVIEVPEGTEADPNDTFKFTIDVDNLETKEVNDTNNDDLWFNVRDKNGNNVTFDEVPEGWTPEAGSTYYYAPNGTTLEVELKAGDNLRFTNLKVGSKFTVVEGDLDKYSIKKIEFIENYKENETDEEETENIIDTINNNKTIANKTIDEDNRTYTVKYTNTYERVDVKVKKVWIDETNDGVKPDEVTAKLLYSDDTEVQGAAVATMNEDNNWEYTWKGLDRYKNGEEITYKVKELVEDISAHYESNVEGSMKTGFTITNTRDENDITVDKSVKKVWNDADDQDGKRPTSLNVNLVKVTKTEGENGTTITNKELVGTVTLDKDNKWTDTIDELPKYEHGEEIEYKWEEATLPTGYTLTDTTTTETETGKLTTLTNTHTPEKINVEVEKKWEDNKDQDGIRPTTVEVTLYSKTASETSKTKVETVTLGENGTWTKTWENQPKYRNKELITYSIVETTTDVIGDTDGPGTYKQEVDKEIKENSGKITVTNTHTPEKINVEVEKKWEDNKDQDGIRPTTVEVTLYSKTASETSKTKVETVTLGENGTWTKTWENQPKYRNKELITYSIEETTTDVIGDTDGPGTYKQEVDKEIKENSGKITVTNTHTPEKINVEVEKKWEDNKDQDGIRPTTVEVTLYSKTASEPSKTKVETVTLGENGTWTKTWENQPKYRNKELITYSIVETTTDVIGDTDGPGTYKQEVDKEITENSGKITVTNTHTPEKINVEVEKKWVDNKDQDGIRPETVEVTLYSKTASETSKTKVETVTLGENGTWTKTWENQPKYRNKELITYSIEETTTNVIGDTDGPGTYKQEVDKEITENSGKITVTNTHTPDELEISVEKKWEDNNDQDGIRPATVEVTLYSKTASETSKTKIETVTLGENGTWTKTWENQPKYRNKELITYSIEETTTNVIGDTDGPGTYKQEVDKTITENSGKITVTNTHTPEKINVEVEKKWVDNNDQDGIRPETVEVTLYSKTASETSKTKVETVTLGENGTWTKTWENQPKYRNKELITYSIVETTTDVITDTDGHDTYKQEVDKEITENSGKITVTNTHTPAKINVTISKQWIDEKNAKNTRPESKLVKLTLKANGEDVETVEVKETEGWEYTFTGLDEFAGRERIIYTVEEKEENVPENYSVSYSEDGLTAINTVNELKKDIPVTKFWEDANNQDGYRNKTIRFKLEARIGEELLDEQPQPIELTSADAYKDPETGEVDNNKWLGVFKNVPTFKDGKLISYQLVEELLDENGNVIKEEDSKYATAIEGNSVDGYEVTNTHIPETVDINATKNWADNEDNDGKRPTEITLNVYAGDSDEVVKTETISIDNAHVNENGEEDLNKWEVTFTGLPKFKDGKEIEYRVEEVMTEQLEEYYEQTENETGEADENNIITSIITNTHTPITITYTITKKWDDLGDQDRLRPDSLKVTITGDTANNKGIYTEAVTLSEGNKWTHKFEDLPKYYKKELVQYTITEEEVLGYEPGGSITQAETTEDTDNITNTITNTHKPETITIEGEKIWDDDNNINNKRPDYIEVILYANGEESQIFKITKENNWKYSLEVYKNKDGEEIVYTIEEILPDDYIARYDGFNIINSYIGKGGDVEELPPQTGINKTKKHYNISFIIGLLISLIKKLFA